jgi:hypothetical protein
MTNATLHTPPSVNADGGRSARLASERAAKPQNAIVSRHRIAILDSRQKYIVHETVPNSVEPQPCICEAPAHANPPVPRIDCRNSVCMQCGRGIRGFDATFLHRHVAFRGRPGGHKRRAIGQFRGVIGWARWFAGSSRGRPVGSCSRRRAGQTTNWTGNLTLK